MARTLKAKRTYDRAGDGKFASSANKARGLAGLADAQDRYKKATAKPKPKKKLKPKVKVKRKKTVRKKKAATAKKTVRRTRTKKKR